jgi:hypothetical protein
MKALIVLAGLCLLSAPAAAQPAASVQPEAGDVERAALARRYLELAQPDWLSGGFEVDHTLLAFDMPRTMEEANLAIAHAPPSSAPVSRIIYGQLKASFERGARQIAPELADALVAVYAERLTAEELRAMIAFEEQPGQRAAEAAKAHTSARMQAYFDAEGARWDEELKADVIAPPTRPAPVDDLASLIPSQAQPAPDASPTWVAIAAKQNAIYLASYSALNRLWPKAAAIALADYCAHLACRATDREILTGLGQVFADPNNRV